MIAIPPPTEADGKVPRLPQTVVAPEFVIPE
jgi:hypothetical protein